MRKETKLFTWINLALLGLFTILYLSAGNVEFLFYVVTLGALVGVLAWTDKKFTFSTTAFTLFTIWLTAHLVGGYAKIGDTRLYDYIFVNIVGDPYNILKYDQILHFFCYFMVAFFMYDILKKIAKPKASVGTIAFIAVMAASGIGGVNEIIEFLTVVFLGAAEAVGGYENTALDICTNFLGALTAAIFLSRRGK
ncbi:MAG: putative membrane protein YjdF [Candidatus Woesearchaeota archaeon]|jgi:uncharacterized membrane protein YjdF